MQVDQLEFDESEAPRSSNPKLPSLDEKTPITRRTTFSSAHVADHAARDLSVAFRNGCVTQVVSLLDELGAVNQSGVERRVFSEG